MHTQIVSVVNGEPLTSTSVISQGMKAKHKNVLELVRKHVAALGSLGRVAFETQPLATRGGMQAREVAMLNERQAALPGFRDQFAQLETQIQPALPLH